MQGHIVSANTLIGAPEQIHQAGGLGLFVQDEYFDKFNALTGQYFGTYEPAEKKKLTKKIEKLVNNKVQDKVDEIQRQSTHTDERFSKRLAEKNKAIIEQKKNDAKLWESYNNLFKHESVGFFDTKYFFPEVKEGFDVVIGNPPYFNLNTVSKDLYRYLAEHYKVIHTGYNDIVYYFIYLGIEFLNKTGCCALITSNYWLGNDYARSLRKYLKGHVSKILNFKDHMVFDEASIHTCISISQKEATSAQVLFFEAITDEKITSSDIEAKLRSFAIRRSDLNEDWLIADQSASSIFGKLNKDSILMGDIATIEQGSKSGKNNVFTISYALAKEKKFEKELLRRNVKNGDIDRYTIRDRGNYLIYVDNHTEIKKFAKIYSYLESYKEVLKDRNEVANGLYPWYRFDRPRNKAIFDAQEKIVVPYRAENNRFAYDDAQYFNDGGDIRAIVISDGKVNIKYVLALLNSSLLDWFYGFIGKPKGKAREYFNKPLSLIPIKKISSADQQPFIALVDQILTAKKQHTPQSPLDRGEENADTTALEKQIDEMVYKLYGLTPEEIAIVEGRK